MMPNTTATSSTTPVSYTHLDVYKRQLQGTLIYAKQYSFAPNKSYENAILTLSKNKK